MSGAAPLLAALLGAALPGSRALDLGLPAPPRLFPWLPGTLCGVADTEAAPPAETGLLRRFRHADGRPLVGFDRTADAALLAGTPAAWGGARERLIRLATTPPAEVSVADALLLVPGGTEAPPGTPRGRVILLLGAGETVERDDLLVPPHRLEATQAALRDAAQALAQTAGGGRWLARAQTVSPTMASVALLPEEAQSFRPAVQVPASALVHDLPARAGPDGLDLTDARRVRMLLGASPVRARVFLAGEASGVALFGDGRRLAATAGEAPPGQTCLEAEMSGGEGAAVLGLAWPAPARLALVRLELLP